MAPRSFGSRSAATGCRSIISTTTSWSNAPSTRSVAIWLTTCVRLLCESSRWPAAFPQYRPFHQDWLARVEAALPAGLHVTGASYRGIGVAACIAQAGRTAAVVAARVDRRPATLER